MNSEKIKAYLHLSRPVNVLITFVSIPVACWIAKGGTGNWLKIVLAASTGALVTAGANALNDAFDIEIDRINRPERPLPRGILQPIDARRMWLFVSCAAIIINTFINLAALAISVLAVVFLYYYSARLKRTVLAGNIVIALMTGMAFIYGGAAVGRIERAIVPAVFAFLVNLARELVKDVEDVDGDRREQAITLPVKYGEKPALVLATVSLVLLIAITIAVIKTSMYSPAFMYGVISTDLLLLSAIFIIWQNIPSSKLRRVSVLLKSSMIVGLISIIAGSL